MLQELTTTTKTITTAIIGRGEGAFLEQNSLGKLEHKQLHLVSDQLSACPLLNRRAETQNY